MSVAGRTNINFYVLGVSCLIAFLAYPSQLLFRTLEPELDARSPWIFNVLVACLWICYYRACRVDPGGVPEAWEDIVSRDVVRLDAIRRDGVGVGRDDEDGNENDDDEHLHEDDIDLNDDGDDGHGEPAVGRDEDEVDIDDDDSGGDKANDADDDVHDGPGVGRDDDAGMDIDEGEDDDAVADRYLVHGDEDDGAGDDDDVHDKGPAQQPVKRWCKKCETFKPPRSHHCKQCRQCIPKMDHHCPWSGNCVSHTTFPHFMRFLVYAVAAMTHLQYMLYLRVAVIWSKRDLPSYMGPSMPELSLLFVLVCVNSIAWFAVTIMMVRTAWCLALNVTTIEGWEIERHEALLQKARTLGGFVYGPGGVKVRITKREFPYDVGIWKNIKLGMGGGGTMLSWLWPLARTPSIQSGLDFPVNDFEDASVTWPPPDPERLAREARIPASRDAFTFREDHLSAAEQKAAFRRRQDRDTQRRRRVSGQRQAVDGNVDESSLPGHGKLNHESSTSPSTNPYNEEGERIGGPIGGHDGTNEYHQAQRSIPRYQRSWRDGEGQKLEDFGVDEDAESAVLVATEGEHDRHSTHTQLDESDIRHTTQLDVSGSHRGPGPSVTGPRAGASIVSRRPAQSARRRA